MSSYTYPLFYNGTTAQLIVLIKNTKNLPYQQGSPFMHFEAEIASFIIPDVFLILIDQVTYEWVTTIIVWPLSWFEQVTKYIISWLLPLMGVNTDECSLSYEHRFYSKITT